MVGQVREDLLCSCIKLICLFLPDTGGIVSRRKQNQQYRYSVPRWCVENHSSTTISLSMESFFSHPTVHRHSHLWVHSPIRLAMKESSISVMHWRSIEWENDSSDANDPFHSQSLTTLNICHTHLGEEGVKYLVDTLNRNEVRCDRGVSTIDVSFLSFCSDSHNIENQSVIYRCCTDESLSSWFKHRHRKRRSFHHLLICSIRRAILGRWYVCHAPFVSMRSWRKRRWDDDVIQEIIVNQNLSTEIQWCDHEDFSLANTTKMWSCSRTDLSEDCRRHRCTPLRREGDDFV